MDRGVLLGLVDLAAQPGTGHTRDNRVHHRHQPIRALLALRDARLRCLFAIVVRVGFSPTSLHSNPAGY